MEKKYYCSNFKKGEKTIPEITLLSSTLKEFTEATLTLLNQKITRKDEKQCFMKNHSTIDDERALEYNNPAFMYYIDFSKALDRVKLNDVLSILEGNEYITKK